MQTTLPSNQSISVQTDAAAAGVDAETLVDEFFVDDKEKKVSLLNSFKKIIAKENFV